MLSQKEWLYIGLIIFAILYALFRIYIIGYESKYQGSEELITGILVNYTHQEGKYNLTVKGKEKIKVTMVTKEKLDLKLGMKIEVKGALTKPLRNTIPNTFNYRAHLEHHGIYYLMKATKVKVISQVSFKYAFKNYLTQRIDNYKYTSEYLKTFIMGDKTELDPDTYRIYRENGVAHLFAISGMHINIISLIILWGLKKLKIKEGHQYLIVIACLLSYVMITNYAASIYRSILFFILMRINKRFSLALKTISVLLLTCSILIILNPLIIFDLGFQYSAVVTLGLILTSKYYRKGYFRNLLLVSTFAFLFSLPITLFYFYEINLLGIINNLLFVPLISIIIYPLSLMTVFIKYLEPLLYIGIKIMELLNLGLNRITNLTIIIPKVSLYYYLIYYLLLLLFILSNNKKYLMFGIMLIFSFKLKYYLDPKTYIYFLDVGQGDSTLIYNRREAILVDTGGNQNYHVSDNIIVLLKSLGINQLDLLLLTHGDFDHLGEALNILDKFKVKRVMINNNEQNDLETKIINVLAPVREYQSKLLKIYQPMIDKDENKSSLVGCFTISKHHILLLGDITKEGELLLLKEQKMIASIVKLAHHGSKTSSDPLFLETINAREAIISSGRNNIFGHPSAITLETLNNLAIKYYNTAESGTIKYTFRQNNYTVKLYPP